MNLATAFAVMIVLLCSMGRVSAEQVELPHYPASLEGTLKSTNINPNVVITINFYNKLSQPINVYWLDYSGNRSMPILNVQPGESTGYYTFFGHPFLVTDANGVGMFIVAAYSQTPSGWKATTGGDVQSLTIEDANIESTLVDLSDEMVTRITPANIASLGHVGRVCTGAVADGATKLLLRYIASSPGTVSFAASGRVSGDKLRCVDSLLSAVNVPTRPINGQNVAFALYTVPESLDTTAEAVAFHYTEHTVRFQAALTRSDGIVIESPSVPLVLKSPPVLLVHGLYSGPGTWSLTSGPYHALLNGNFHVYLADYWSTHAASLDTNRNILRKNNGAGIDGICKEYRQGGTAITKVDVVGHSMGGLLTRRLAAPDNNYKNPENFQSGYVRRLITLGTPNLGTPIADKVVALCNGSKGSFYQYLMLFTPFPSSAAIGDMQTNSPALAKLGTTPIPYYAEVGNYSLEDTQGFDSLYDELMFLDDTIPLPPESSSFAEKNSALFSGDINDLAVSKTSATDGISGSSFVHGFTNHLEETHSDLMGPDVAYLLAGPLTGTLIGGFYLNGIPPAPAAPALPASPSLAQPKVADTPFVTISGPTEGQTYAPGDTVTVSVQPNLGATVARVLIVAGRYPTSVGSALLSEPPYTASFTISSAYLGSLPIAVVAMDSPGNVCDVSVTANVVTPAHIGSIGIAPSQVTLTSIGSTANLTVTGTFSDGISRDVTPGTLGTTYSSNTPSLATVDANGVVTAKASGSAVITATNGAASATATVLVDPGAPGLFDITPSACLAGDTVPIVITGADLGAASHVVFYLNGAIDPTMSASNISVDTLGTSLTATVSVLASAPLGTRTVVVATPGGLTDPFAPTSALGFTVGPLAAAPTNVTAVSGNELVTVNWTASSGATGYNVYRGAVSGGEDPVAVATGIVATSYTDTGLTNGAWYYYKVAAANDAGTSTQSNEAAAMPFAAAPQAQIAVGSATIDGVVDPAWSNAVSYPINQTRETISGGSDCSASWKALWNTANLYLLVDVTDDTKTNDSTDIWQDDSVELYLDADHNGGTVYDPNDRQFQFRWNDAAAHEGFGRPMAGVVFAQTDPTSTSYRIEARIPWSVEAFTPTVNAIIGIDVHINDDDTGNGRDGKLLWNDATDDAWHDPSLFGTGSLNAGALPPPTSLTATPGNGKVTLAWHSASGATSYNVKRSSTSGGPYITITNQPGVSYTNLGLTNGVAYYFAVSAVNANGESLDSAQASATPIAPPPAPAFIIAWGTDMTAWLVWAPPPGATAFRIRRGTTSGGPYTTIATVTNNLWANTGLTNNTTYYYVVAGTNAGGDGPNSAEASATPFAVIPPIPTGLTAKPGDTKTTLSWTASSGATFYRVRRGTVSGIYTTIATVTNNLWANTGLSNGTTYYYVVAAGNSAGTSANSTQTSTTPGPPPPAPTGLTATPGNEKATLTWNASGGATGYRVRRGTVNGGPYSTVASVGGTAWVNSGLTNGTTYYYVVAGFNSYGDGPPSAQASVTPHP
jgi:fibronectin type 3 domain-containing protein/pimeloyl-ACP methyl ester carboxylesterase